MIVMGHAGRKATLAMLVFVATTVCSLLSASVAAPTEFYENWEGGIDPVIWNIWGFPSPILLPGEGWLGSQGMDPNGDAWCQSGVWSVDPVSWDPGDTLSMRFMTNVHGDPRGTNFQMLRLGLTTGWIGSGPCAPNDGVENIVYFAAYPELGTGEVMKLMVQGSVVFEAPYPPSMDGVWHKVGLTRASGGAFGAVELWFDNALLTTADLTGPLPTLHVYVDGRSVGMVNSIDEITLEPSGSTAVESVTWSHVKALYR